MAEKENGITKTHTWLNNQISRGFSQHWEIKIFYEAFKSAWPHWQMKYSNQTFAILCPFIAHFMSISKHNFMKGGFLKTDLNLFRYLSNIDTAFKCLLCICLLFWKESIAVQIYLLFFCRCCIWDHSRFVSKCIKYVHKSVDMLLCIVRCRSRKSIQTFLIRFLVSKLFSVQLPFIILLDMESMLACRYFCPVHLEYIKVFPTCFTRRCFKNWLILVLCDFYSNTKSK